jgi:DeoR/GlpR family transcriptional regulator of sugar metabolism
LADVTDGTAIDGTAANLAPRPVPGARGQVPAGRRRLILQLLRARGSVSVAQLEHEFGISAMTARRDLSVLEEEGLAHRTYGGAVLPASAAVEDSFEQRIGQAVEAKTRLARATLEFVADGATVFADSSTTAYFAIRELIAAGRDVTVVTNSLPVMQLVGDAGRSELVGLGGSYRVVARSFVGPDTVRTARSLLADRALISVKGLTSDGALSDPDPLEAEVKRVMIEQSTESILLLDASKLEGRGLAVIANLEDVNLVLAADVSDGEALLLGKLARDVRRV